MIKPITTAVVFLGFGLTVACGDASKPRETGLDAIAYPDGFPFAVAAISLSDLCDNALSQSCNLAVYPPPGATLVEISQPAPGRLCLTGSVGSGGWGALGLGYSVYGGDGIEQVFDADSLGITQVRFKLEGPPPGGLVVKGVVVATTHCPVAPGRECRVGGWTLTDPKVNKVLELKKSGEVVMPFADFVQQEDGPKDFDTSKLEGFFFDVLSAGPVNVCLSDFEFLDKDGNVVTP
jgi:hypothetical protein